MYTLSQIKLAFAKKGYTLYERGQYNLNIIGIRSEIRVANRFDDELVLLYRDENNIQKILCFPVTTDPGLDSLVKPINTKGCAILVPGQYKGIWAIGLHRGKYRALVQVNTCTVYRDYNRDNMLDMNPDKLESGLFGINLHRAAMSINSIVGPWSAGCQVLKNSSDFDTVMELCTIATKYYPNSFSYTLFDKKDIV